MRVSGTSTAEGFYVDGATDLLRKPCGMDAVSGVCVVALQGDER
jgi:hypothetical protein